MGGKSFNCGQVFFTSRYQLIPFPHRWKRRCFGNKMNWKGHEYKIAGRIGIRTRGFGIKQMFCS